MAGIEVVPDICGEPEEVIAALCTGAKELERLRSPGSRRWLKRPGVREDSRPRSEVRPPPDGR
jgi:hypothetical protein